MAINNEPMLSSYLHARGAKLGLPISGTFELTARCNFSCPMCYVHQKNSRPEQELTADQWLQIARQARDSGMMFVLLTGGEPFVRKDFFQIYEGMKDMGLMIAINSNGSLLSGEIRRKLIENPPIRMNISLYGGSRETYRSMCGRDAFSDVVENICALKRAGIDVRLNYSITPYNQQDMQKILEISKQIGVHIKASSYMYPPVRVDGVDTGSRLNAMQSADCSVEWDRLKLSSEEFLCKVRSVQIPDCAIELEDGISCRGGVTSFWTTWDGRMLPCGMMPGVGADILGQGFSLAWENTKASTREIRMPKECNSCPKRSMCNVCAAVCITETGHFDRVPEYVCQRTDEVIRMMKLYAEKERL